MIWFAYCGFVTVVYVRFGWCCGVYLLCLIAMSDGWFGSLIVT